MFSPYAIKDNDPALAKQIENWVSRAH